jgi:hypothetical protein
LFDQAVALRQSVSPSDRARTIAATFQRAGFRALLRESGETFKKAGFLTTAARCFAQIDDKNEALTLLETCARRRCSDIVSLNVEPDFDGLRDEARFQQLLRQIGLR